MFTTSAFSASDRVANTARMHDMGGSGVESGMGAGTSAGLGVIMRILWGEVVEVLDEGAGSPLQSRAMCLVSRSHVLGPHEDWSLTETRLLQTGLNIQSLQVLSQSQSWSPQISSPRRLLRTGHNRSRTDTKDCTGLVETGLQWRTPCPRWRLDARNKYYLCLPPLMCDASETWTESTQFLFYLLYYTSTLGNNSRATMGSGWPRKPTEKMRLLLQQQGKSSDSSSDLEGSEQELKVVKKARVVGGARRKAVREAEGKWKGQGEGEAGEGKDERYAGRGAEEGISRQSDRARR